MVRERLFVSALRRFRSWAGGGGLGEAVGRLPAVPMDERATLIYDTRLGKRVGGGGLTKPDLIPHTAGLENNITPLGQWSR